VAIADEIAIRWTAQMHTVAQIEVSSAAGIESARRDVEACVRVIATALLTESASSESIVGLGLTMGTAAFEQGASLHHTLKGIDLLVAMVLYAAETAVSVGASPDETVSDGVHLCRRVQQAVSLLSLALVNGYTQAVGVGMRDQFRALRHDLRNPLGTIKSVLALMDDESMPAEARSNPRFRAMAKRNARSLEAMIVARLGDEAAVMPALAHQYVSLRTLASGVRRELRAEATMRNVRVMIAPAGPRVHVNAASLELVLLAVLEAVLAEARDGEEVRIDFDEVRPERATIVVACVPRRSLVQDSATLKRLHTLAGHMGTVVELNEQAVLSVPVHSVAGVTDGGSDSRQPLDDIGSTSQRPHVEPGVL
jgi:signal transduction histidine kinase